jgi:AcrR family transcriptional regulator
MIQKNDELSILCANYIIILIIMNIEIFKKIDFRSILKDPNKGFRRKIQIAEATIVLMYKHGLDKFTYDLLAKKCKISRGVIYTYFPKLDDLLMFTCGMIRYQYQNWVVGEIGKHQTPLKILETYILTALKWVEVYPLHASTWLLFFHHCAHEQDFAQFNAELVDQGSQRITAILNLAIKVGEIKLAVEHTPSAARIIQTLITGSLLAHATERRSLLEWESERNLILDTVFRVIKKIDQN